MTLLRVSLGFMGIATLLGLVWFIDDVSRTYLYASLFAGVSLIVLALIPTIRKQETLTRGIGALGIISELSLMYLDYPSAMEIESYGSDYGAVYGDIISLVLIVIYFTGEKGVSRPTGRDLGSNQGKSLKDK